MITEPLKTEENIIPIVLSEKYYRITDIAKVAPDFPWPRSYIGKLSLIRRHKDIVQPKMIGVANRRRYYIPESGIRRLVEYLTK